MRETLVGVSDSRGLIRVTFNWPVEHQRRIQRLPDAATRAVLTVTSEAGDEVAVREFFRAGSSSVAAIIALAPGSAYTISATLFDGKGALVAEGTSESFSVQRQRVSTVDLAVSPVVSPVAGIGTFGFAGDNGPATLAQLYMPLGLAVASNGDLLFVDEANHAIRRVDAEGSLSTVVGTLGKSAPSTERPVLGDSVPVAEALLNSPDDLAVAPNGDLLIADTTNKALRILPAESGERYGQSLTADRLHTLFTSTAPGAPSLRAVAVDRDGSVFIVESHRIHMITPGGAQVQLAGTTSTGNGVDGPALQSQLDRPDSLILDGSGNLFFSEIGNDRVRLLCREPGTYFGIPMASGSVYTIAGVGNATSEVIPLGDGGDGLEASFNTPYGLALDAKGNLFIADSSNHRIRVLSPERRISTFAGTGSKSNADGTDLGDGGAAAMATFAGPRGLLIHQGYLYITDSSNYRIRRIPL
jgi:sugar lactone lactonase YvrE